MVNKSKLSYLIILTFIILIPLAVTARLITPRYFKKIVLGQAVCNANDSTLIISTGKIRRVYKFTPWGMFTAHLDLLGKNPVTIVNSAYNQKADWDLGLKEKSVLRNITAGIDDDSGFTSKHITVTADFDYLTVGISLRYLIWIYPGSGIRTQIELKHFAKEGETFNLDAYQSEYIPMLLKNASISAFGYYNGTQNRDMDSTPILKETVISPDANINWANGLIIDRKINGVVLVKESHKCVNQSGINSGSFIITQNGVAVTGLGLSGKDLKANVFKKCWATWIIPYVGDSTDGRLALKVFDRMRYPVRAEDNYIMANTWGSSDNSPEGDGRYAARQNNVLKEIASQSDLGIDVQEIDDGWQGLTYQHWRPAASAVLFSRKDSSRKIQYNIYPDGWTPVKKYAAQKDVKLGLWSAWDIPEKEMKWNYDHGGFNYFKIDFSVLDTKEKLDNLMNKIRSFILYTQHHVKINWDATENAPRIGYFYAREYGNIALENRKPAIPENVIYKPYLVLRDVWQLSKYINLNQFQIPIQNVKKVDSLKSDACLYTNAYATAIGLMGSPLFFNLTQSYPDKDRQIIKSILSIYKKYRNDIYKGYVFPIGAVPDDASWTGFQDYIPGSDTGYLLIFRELYNKKNTYSVGIQFIKNKYIVIKDIYSGSEHRVFVDKDGLVKLTIPKPACFRFYRYKVINS